MSIELRLVGENAPMTIDTQTEQYGNSVKNGGSTSQI